MPKVEGRAGSYVAMSASAGCGQYRRIAVLEVEGPEVTPAMISHRARGVVRIVRRWERLHVGSTPRCAFDRSRAAARELAATLHLRSSLPDAVGHDLLPVLRAWYVCIDAREWVEARPDRTLAELWAECPRGDWMLHLAARAGVDRRHVVLAACDVSALALAHVPAGEERPRRAIEVARRWARGEATAEEVRAAADDARDATTAARRAAAHVARAAEGVGGAYIGFVAAEYAADAAHAAAAIAAAAEYGVADAVAAADAASAAAAIAAADFTTARATSLAQCADIVRSWIDAATIVAALAAARAQI
jgi:hypothetical protein